MYTISNKTVLGENQDNRLTCHVQHYKFHRKFYDVFIRQKVQPQRECRTFINAVVPNWEGVVQFQIVVFRDFLLCTKIHDNTISVKVVLRKKKVFLSFYYIKMAQLQLYFGLKPSVRIKKQKNYIVSMMKIKSLYRRV